MTSSGVEVNDAVRADFDLLKKDKKISHVLLAVEGGDWVTVAKSEENAEYDHEAVLALLKAHEDDKGNKRPCAAIVDFPATYKDGRTNPRPVLLSWCPDEAPARYKMSHASSVLGLKSSLDINVLYQANDLVDLEFDKINAKLV